MTYSGYQRQSDYVSGGSLTQLGGGGGYRGGN